MDGWSKAQAMANICEQFQRLVSEEHLSLVQAARALGRSPSLFSGEHSVLAQYRRGGVAALVPARRAPCANVSDLTRQIEALGWFLPAARFFYLLTNRTWKSGSVPEAIRRTISLPHLPKGWDHKIKSRFEKVVASSTPSCPPDLREAILAREKTGLPLVPERIARKVTASPAVVRQYRNATNASLDYLAAPGGMRLIADGAGQQRLARAGEIIEADDATINFPVCVPWNRGGDICADKFGVRVGRFQWLLSICAGTSFISGFNYTARPRSSYRGEDVLSLLRIVALQHGIPRRWRLEQGVWKSHLVTRAIRHMGSELDTVYSPHQKPFIEGVFNTLWTKLSVHFPGSQVGRYRGEHEVASDLLTACQRGQKDPRRHFPMLADVIAAFQEVIAEKNRTPVNSAHHGRWVPEERWEAELDRPALSADSEWMFAPFVREWTVKGMLVGGRVPMFEDLSVPFDFSAPWLPNWDGAKVRAHFDPSAPRCHAMLVLAEDRPGHRAGEVLGLAQQINETAGYVRLVMGWGDDPAMAGALARQTTAAAMRREVRAIMPRGAAGATHSEERDGVSLTTKLEKDSLRGSVTSAPEAEPSTLNSQLSTPIDRSARTRELAEFERDNAQLFT